MNAKNITSEKEINKVNMSRLYANEFKVMVVKMLDKHLQMRDEWISTVRISTKSRQYKEEPELKNTITEIKIQHQKKSTDQIIQRNREKDRVVYPK